MNEAWSQVSFLQLSMIAKILSHVIVVVADLPSYNNFHTFLWFIKISFSFWITKLSQYTNDLFDKVVESLNKIISSQFSRISCEYVYIFAVV